MIQSFFLLSPNGEILIEKHWRAVTPRVVCEDFWEQISNYDSKNEVPPVLILGRYFLLSMYHEASGMVLLAVTVQETPTLLVFEFLQRLIDIFVEYFGEFDETIIKDNFSTVYQILEEMMDFGYPLTTEPNALKAMIEPPTLISRLTSVTIGYKSGVSDTLPSATISNMPWRKADVKYAANEIYLDIIEEVDAIIDKHGQLVSFDVTGSIMGNSRLSGVPDLTLQFVDPSVIDDCSFHPCVRYNRYERDHAVSFVPPDGQFELMRYRPVLQVPGTGGPGGTKGSSKDMSSYGGASRMVGFGSSSAPSTAPSQQQSSSSAGFQFIPPLFCQPQVSMGTSSMSSISSSSSASFDASLTGHISVTIGTRPDSTLIFPNRTRGGSVVVEDVVALIPFSKSVRTVNLTATQGSVLFDEATKVAKWTVGKLGSDKRPILTGTIFRNAPGVQGGIPTASGATATDATEVCCVLPIQLTWKVPTASVSGLAIASLQLTNEVYKPFKGMRTQTQSGKFLIRCTY